MGLDEARDEGDLEGKDREFMAIADMLMPVLMDLVDAAQMALKDPALRAEDVNRSLDDLEGAIARLRSGPLGILVDVRQKGDTPRKHS